MTLIDDTRTYVATNIKCGFHDKRLASLEALKLNTILKRKNPYLFRAKAVSSAPDLVKQFLDAHLSSNEETLFGQFLESLAIYVCGCVYGGVKSTSEGIDLEFTRNDVRYAVSIKSGPDWGNASQKKKMQSYFDRIRRVAGPSTRITCVNGCCYGKDSSPHKTDGNYLKLCGQDFWSLISGEPLLYQTLVDPLGTQAKLRCDEFNQAYGRVINRFTADFIEQWCQASGAIDWPKLLAFNSGSKNPWTP